MFDINKIREDFPILNRLVHGKKLVYLDNAATTQKPVCVLDVMNRYYTELNSNIHRGVHYLSAQATEEFEIARKYIGEIINAEFSREIIFTRGATESINLVAYSFGSAFVKNGDEIIISEVEHHANIVPWQLLCERNGAVLKVVPVDEHGVILIDEFKKLLSEKTKLVSVTYASNVLGTVQPIKQIIEIAHSVDVPVLIDGAQAVSHFKVDVKELDCDFFVFSGHKVYAPMGIGVLYGKEKWLEKMPPFLGGGEMIDNVTFEKSTFNELPYKFEAGTPDVGGVLALKAAFEYIYKIGIEDIASHEHKLLDIATEGLLSIRGIDIYGLAKDKTAVVSFNIKGVHSFDTGTILDNMGIAVRTGHHCAQPLMGLLCVPGTVRASFALYNTEQEVYILLEGIKKAQKMLV